MPDNESRTYAAALCNVADCLPHGMCDVAVYETEITGYRVDGDGADVPDYGLTDRAAMAAVDTDVPVAGDQAGLAERADAVLAANGWTRTGDWEPSQNAYYADVVR